MLWGWRVRGLGLRLGRSGIRWFLAGFLMQRGGVHGGLFGGVMLMVGS
jgi:hypothetical protein